MNREIDIFKDPLWLLTLHHILLTYKTFCVDHDKYMEPTAITEFHNTNTFLDEIEKRVPAIRLNRHE